MKAVSQIVKLGGPAYSNVREAGLVDLSKMLVAMDGGKQAYMDVLAAVFGSPTAYPLLH
jgi:hypothetical protein